MGIRTPFDPLGTTGNQRGLPFTFTIDTRANPDDVSDKTFIVPLTPGTYSSLAGENFGIIWGDGEVTVINDGIFTQENCTHTYANPGRYTISLKSSTDTAPKFNFHDNYADVNNNPLKIIAASSSILNQIDTDGNEILTYAFYWTFHNCRNLNSISPNLFKNNPNITTNAFRLTFENCTSLTSIPVNLFRYNTEVTESAFYWTFAGCTRLTAIPAALFRYNTEVSIDGFDGTFYGCTSLTTIPDNLFLYNTKVGTDGFKQTFCNCTNLTTIPTNLFYTNTLCTSFYHTFYNCPKLTINPYIFGNYDLNPELKTTRFNNLDAQYTFEGMFYRDTFTGTAGTSGTPGDYWTWTYQQTPVGTQCYGGQGNLNITGYEDIPPTWGGPAWYRLTVNATPADSSISLQAPGYTQVDNYIEVRFGTQVTWTVSKSYYITQTNTVTVSEDTTINVSLDPVLYTFTIVPTPADSTVTLISSDPTYVQSGNQISVPRSTNVTWIVARNHYITQTNTVEVLNSNSLAVTLIPETYTVTINPTPSDATVIINGVERTTAQFVYNTQVIYSVSKLGYNRVNDQFFIDQDTTLDIEIVETYYTFTVVPNPADATVIIDGVERTSITARADSEITFSVTKPGYMPYDDTFTLVADTIKEVELPLAYRFTVTPTPANATVTLIAEYGEQAPGTNYIDTEYGDTITWTVECEDYVTQSGTYVITEDTTFPVTLAVQTYRFTIEPTPPDATVTLTAPGFTQVDNYIDVTKNTTIDWSVTRFGYDPASGTQFIAKADVTLPVTLVGNTYVDVEDYTYTETISGVTIIKYIGSGNNIIAPHLEVEEH